MTPFELELERELNVERQRFDSKWLFIWHNINIEGKIVDVEDFRGGRFHVGGIVFEGQIQELFWQARDRYLQGKVHEIFKRWDSETKSYPTALRLSSLEGTGYCLRRFAATIVRGATQTDKALRGRGNPSSVAEYSRATAPQTRANVEIMQLVEAHQRIIQDSAAQNQPAETSVRTRFEAWFANNKALTWAIGLALAMLIGLIKLFIF